MDTVLLGVAITAKPGDRVIELGCGSGAALLIAAVRNPEVRFLGLERDPDLVALAQANVRANPTVARAVEIAAGNALAPDPPEREAFQHAFFNPPYHDDPSAMRLPRDAARRAAFVNEEGGVALWIAAALARVRTRGRVTLIHRADRLADVLAALSGPAGEIRVRPIHPMADAPASRIVVRARKGARSPLTIAPPLVLHKDDGGFTEEVADILNGARGLALEG
jgi:tRNA1(Val) A37 N6-methylase TrmN6